MECSEFPSLVHPSPSTICCKRASGLTETIAAGHFLETSNLGYWQR
jgi:hypothetical protein